MADTETKRAEVLVEGNTRDPKEVESTETGPAQAKWSLKRLLGLGACCAAPLLAGAVFAGGGGALLGAAGAVLPFLAALACPLGMYFMMRSMSKMGQENSDDKGKGE